MVTPAAYSFSQDSVTVKRPECPIFSNTKFLEDIEYPDEAKEYCIKGMTILRFMIDTAGKVSGVTVQNGVSDVLDKHATMLLNKTSGYWKAGSVNGKPENIWMAMAFDYHIYTTRSSGVLFSSRNNNTLIETTSFYTQDRCTINCLGHACALNELAYYNKGVKQFAKGNSKEALSNFELAAKINYADYHALFNCAVIYINQNESEKACPYLLKVQQTGGKDVSDMITKFCPASAEQAN